MCASGKAYISGWRTVAKRTIPHTNTQITHTSRKMKSCGLMMTADWDGIGSCLFSLNFSLRFGCILPYLCMMGANERDF